MSRHPLTVYLEREQLVAIERQARLAGIGLVTVLRRSPISLRHLGFECERADAAQI
jgi:hypothetical protein